MFDVTAVKKHKITLTDYDYQRDIENRLLLSQFSEFDHAVLEEILFSPIRTPLRKMAKNLNCAEEALLPVLEKLSKTGLLVIEGDTVVVDKEVRKYFEIEMEKFEDDFTPGMEFLHHLLKKIPIHVLPAWYSIPRTSNNIFDSVIEKYLLTPQIFQRHLLDINFGNPIISAIAQEVFSSPDLEVPAKQLIKKFQISQEQFHEYMLVLELHFVCCLRYHKNSKGWEEKVSPFHEWRDYQKFLKTTNPVSISNPAKVDRFRPHDFSFVEDLSTLLQFARKQPLSSSVFDTLAKKLPEMNRGESYLEQLLDKLHLLKLIENDGFASTAAAEWLEMRLENRALYLYRHTANRVRSAPQATEKLIREAEKSITRAIHSDWVLFDDFIKGVVVPLGDHPPVSLKKGGKHWKYARPEYTPDERQLIHDVVFEWLFEAGITAIGTYQDKECFMVTPFGQSLFG
jgi:hypothetical protein